MPNATNTNLFPYAGRSFVVNYGENLVFRNTYSADGKMVITDFLAGDMKGAQMTMPFQWRALEGGDFVLSWQEGDKSTVVHIDNFAAGTTQSFYTMMNGQFYRLTGTISE
ncbi:MoaF-related domain-containing protein [Undibacterium sp. TJN25]|uniref:MoaF-related domain-containing protein n=1 Tax=Undibacterium sp. TJN25 TaxID=3413056 RepID=UPI003BF0DFE7